MDADYADGQVLLTNTTTQAEFWLYGQEQVSRGIGLNVNENKTEFMCFKQEGVTLCGKRQKLVDLFTYFGSNISSTESYFNIRIMRALTAIDILSIIWKSDLSDKTKRDFFQAVAMYVLLYGCTTRMKQNAWRKD